jgi:hypothetical protein
VGSAIAWLDTTTGVGRSSTPVGRPRARLTNPEAPTLSKPEWAVHRLPAGRACCPDLRRLAIQRLTGHPYPTAEDPWTPQF